MSTHDDPQSYVDNKRWDYRVENDELVIRDCPFCNSNNFKFSLHRKMGLYRCFVCEADGNMLTLKRHCGDLASISKVEEVWGNDIAYDVVPLEEVRTAHENLKNDLTALQWWYERCLGDDASSAFLIGVVYDTDGRYLTIPYFKDGLCVNIKFRALPPLLKSFKLKPKHEKPLYNVDVIKGKEEVTVVEGEIDAISAVMMGYDNVVSLPNGADSFDVNHFDVLAGKKKINLILDPDAAGRSGARSIANRLGADRCFNVKIPNGMDINELLQKYGYEEGKRRLDACIADAKPFGDGEVVGVRSALQILRDHIQNNGSVESGFSSPWESLNRIAGLISPGEMILLLAMPKTGKTSLAQQWLFTLAERHRVRSMLYCLEMPLWRLAQSLVAHRRLTSRSNLTTLDVSMTEFGIREVPYYYAHPPKEWTFQHCREVIVYAQKRFGIQLLCFDNLQLICRGSENVFQVQADISRGFKQLAMELGIAVLLVVQPRKMSPKMSPGMYDSSGSGALIADADGMITMWRKPLHTSEEEVTDEDLETRDQASFGPEVLIRVPASRYRPGGSAVLWFDGDCATFTEMEENVAVSESGN